MFKAIGSFFRQNWAAIVQVAATALLCSGPLAPVCAGVVAFAVTGVTSGDLGMALRAGVTAFITATAFQVVGKMTAGNLATKIAAHAGVGCVSAMMSGGRCGAGAASAAVSAAGSPFVPDDLIGGTVVSAVLGGLGSVAAGGNFANGAVTAAFGYLFNYCGAKGACTPGTTPYLPDLPEQLVQALNDVDRRLGRVGVPDQDDDLVYRFDRTRVAYDKTYTGAIFATADYRNQTITFYSDILRLSPEELAFVVAHELGHLTPYNHALRAFSLREALSGQIGQSELHADALARQILGITSNPGIFRDMSRRR